MVQLLKKVTVFNQILSLRAKRLINAKNNKNFRDTEKRKLNRQGCKEKNE